METFIPSKAFQVLYDFEGTNERELTVTSGDILLAQEKTSEEDWIFVVKLKDSTKKGFVPAGFIFELSSGETTRYISAWNTDSIPNPSSLSSHITPPISRINPASRHSNFLPSDQKHTPPSSPHLSSISNPSNPLSLSALSSPTRSSSPSRNLEERFSSKRPTTPTSSTGGAVPSSYSSTSPSSPSSNRHSLKLLSATPSPPSASVGGGSTVMEMFAKHEAYLRQVMKQREEKFKELERSISSTGKEIEKYKDLNDSLFQKILKLEGALDSEHGKLKQKILEEEKRVASPTFAQ